MKSILIDLHCPYCGFLSHKKSETLILPAFEPKLRTQILEDRYFHQECPCCHKQISFLHPLLYQDGNHRFMIFLQTQQQTLMPELQEELDYQKRIVFTQEELIEKIRIFEDKLNDAVIEYLKSLLYQKCNVKVYYHDYDTASDTLWFQNRQDRTDMKAIEKSYYHTITGNNFDKNNKKFIFINEENFQDFINFVK